MNRDDRRLFPPTAMLQCFEATAHYGTVSLAASRIGLTQSAVSRQIAQLETWLGRRLFDRIGRRIVLNDDGRAYLDRIARSLDDIRTATRTFVDPAMARTISLATLPAFGMRWLAPRLPALMLHDPDLVVNIAARTDVFSFVAETFDAAIHVGAPDWPGAEHDLLFRERVVPVVAPSLAERERVARPEDFLRLPLLVQSERRHAWQSWFASQGITAEEIRPATSLAHVSMLAQAACAGAGAALLPSFAIQPELESGALVMPVAIPLLEDRSYYLAYPSRALQRRCFARFRQWLVEAAAADA